MDYAPDIYLRNTKNTQRYALGQSGKRMLCAVGLNPSTADDQKPDQTLSKLMGFARRNGFDGFLMLNLYPQRTPYPQKLHKGAQKKLLQDNFRQIQNVLEGLSDGAFLAAWGGDIQLRPYLPKSLAVLYPLSADLGLPWLRIGDFTKAGHPRHPSRAAYRLGLQAFDVEKYLEDLS